TASVDAVICRFGYMLLLDPEAALRETRRVLKPGGRVALAVWDDLERNPWSKVIRDALVARGLAPAAVPDGPGPFALGSEEGIADDVPALTYYLVLSLAPVALGLAALEALLLSNTQAAINVADGLNRFLPDAAHADIRHLVLGTRDNSPVLLAIALATMLWTT